MVSQGDNVGDPKARRHVCTLPVGGGQVFEIEFEPLMESVDTFVQASEALIEMLIAGSKVDDPHLRHDHALRVIRRVFNFSCIMRLHVKIVLLLLEELCSAQRTEDENRRRED